MGGIIEDDTLKDDKKYFHHSCGCLHLLPLKGRSTEFIILASRINSNMDYLLASHRILIVNQLIAMLNRRLSLCTVSYIDVRTISSKRFLTIWQDEDPFANHGWSCKTNAIVQDRRRFLEWMNFTRIAY